MEIDEAFAKLTEQSQRIRDEFIKADNRQWDKLDKISDEVSDIKSTVNALPCEAHSKRVNGIVMDIKENTNWRLRITGGLVVLAFIVGALGIDRWM